MFSAFSSKLKNLKPYAPGEQPSGDYIKLNANESPYPVAPAALEAAIDFAKSHPERLSLYPDPDSLELKKEIAAMLNKTGAVLSKAVLKNNEATADTEKTGFEITSEMIYAGNGSDEVLSFLFYALFEEGQKLIAPEFSYSFYPVYCSFYGVEREAVPLKEWQIDIDEMVSRANKFSAPTIIANPNAPTSLCLTKTQVREMLERCPKDKAFVVDEAYVDFGGESCISLLKDFENLVIVRTFSKSLSGAGMRLGYLVANTEIIEAVTTVKNSVNHFPLDAFTQRLAIEVCKNAAYYVENAKKIVSERESLIEFLREKSWFVLPSSTNFVFAKRSEGANTDKNGNSNGAKMSGKEIYEELKKKGILVRRFDTSGIEEFLRITIGTREQMDALKNALADI